MRQITILVIFFLNFGCKENQDALFEIKKSHETGLHFINIVQNQKDFNILNYVYFFNGGGVAAADFDNDGLVDLFFTGNLVENKLYKNLGKLRFKDVTSKVGFKSDLAWNTAAIVVDINNDKWPDIYVCRSAAERGELRSNQLFINNKNMTFTESASKYGLDDDGFSSSAVFFDFDHDNDQDCFVLNHSVESAASNLRSFDALNNLRDFKSMPKFYENVNGKFVNKTEKVGIDCRLTTFGVSCKSADLNHDGWMDLYLTNDFYGEDFMFINQKNKTFINESKSKLAVFSMNSTGLAIADINNDGKNDIFTTDRLPDTNERLKNFQKVEKTPIFRALQTKGVAKQQSRNMLHVSQENSQFIEVAQMAGIAATDWTWSAIFEDFDQDGYKDLFTTSGIPNNIFTLDFLKFQHETDLMSNPKNLKILKGSEELKLKSNFFKNDGNLKFEKMTDKWLDNEEVIANGAICADLDNDGDLDIITNNINSEAFLYENKLKQKNYLKFPINTLAEGSKITIFAGNERITNEITCNQGFNSSVIADKIIGIGNKKIDSVMITTHESDFLYVLKTKKNSTLLNKDFLQIKNQKNDVFDKYQYQTVTNTSLKHLLSANKIITKGGIESLVNVFDKQIEILTPFKNGFKTKILHPKKSIKDLIVTDFDQDGNQDIALIYDDPKYKNVIYFYLDFYHKNLNLAFKHIVPTEINKIKTTDYNFDGKMDLIVAGKAINVDLLDYSATYLLKNNGLLNFSLSKNFQKQLKNIGAIEVADLNQDGFEDLIFGEEFGKIKVFYHSQNLMAPYQNYYTVGETGIWCSLKSIQLTKDKYPEILAGNEGLNLPSVLHRGVRIYQPLSNRNFKIESFKENNSWFPFQSRDEILESNPSLKKKYPDYFSFAQTETKDIFDEILAVKECKTLQNTLFSNTKAGKLEKFSIGQLSQYFGVKTYELIDWNRDSINDLILIPNQDSYFSKDCPIKGFVVLDGKSNFQKGIVENSKTQVDYVKLLNGKIIIGKSI